MNLAANIKFNQNQALGFRFEVLASAPGSPVTGQAYYDSVLLTALFWNGTIWVSFDASKVNAAYIPLSKLATDPLARANHTGSQLAATISNFDTQVRTSTLNQMGVPTADLSFAGFKLTNVGAAVSGNDAVNLTQLNTIVGNVKASLDVKDSVRLGTTANITLSGAQTIDGVAAIANDRVLVKNQTTTSENGIYTVNAGAWTRTSDAITGTLTPESFVFIEEGSTLATSQWRVTTTGAITVGSTAITWFQFGGNTTYTAGNGIDITGVVVSAKVVASGGIQAVAGGLQIDTAVVVRKLAASIGDGSTTSIVVTHNLGTKDFTWSCRQNSNDEMVFPDVFATTINTATFTFSVAPATNANRVVIQG